MDLCSLKCLPTMRIYCILFLGVFVGVYMDKCDDVQKIDCASQYKSEGNETLCCSDWKVYPNLCFFAQQKCRDPSLYTLYPGACQNTTNNTNQSDQNGFTTPNPSTSIGTPTSLTTKDPIHEVFCEHKDSVNCTSELDPVCGTDNKFYQNNCFFAKGQCDNTSLQVQNDLTVCKTAMRFKRTLQFV